MSRPTPRPAATHPPARTETANRYLETIYCIAAEGETVRPGRIAEWLDVRAPTVTVALQRLARDGWVEIAANHSVALTSSGTVAAEQIVRRHRILERWLTDVLGFDWATADSEADRLFPAVSDEVLARLDESMACPSTCPHGNPIPGRTPPYGDLIPLGDLGPAIVAHVRRISEVAEHEAPQILRQLAALEVHMGSEVRVAGTPVAGAPFDVAVGERTIELPAAMGRFVWVEPQPVTATICGNP